jgi:hypothetical protein
LMKQIGCKCLKRNVVYVKTTVVSQSNHWFCWNKYFCWFLYYAENLIYMDKYLFNCNTRLPDTLAFFEIFSLQF